MNFLRCLPAAVALLTVIGCQHPRHVLIDDSDPTISTSEADYFVLWTAAKNVLRRYRFRLDLVDGRSGRITTYPQGSQHFFEIWRNDVATPRDFWESTLCSIRRRVTVTLDRSSDDPPQGVEVVVRVERFSAPDRQFNSSAAAYHFFSDSLPAVRTGAVIRREDSTWIDLGRDAAMERRILESILDETLQRRRRSENDP